MKTTKIIFLTFLALTLVQCKAQHVIGEIKNGRAEFTVDSNQLIKNWNKNLLSESKIDAELKSIEIFYFEDNYFLRGRGDKYISTISLSKDSKDILSAEGISCTSRGCSTDNGCIPAKNKLKCTDCFGDCTKTVSSFPMTDSR